MSTQVGTIISVWIPSHLMKKQSFLIYTQIWSSVIMGVLGVTMSTLNHIFSYSKEKDEPCRSYPQIQKVACMS